VRVQNPMVIPRGVLGGRSSTAVAKSDADENGSIGVELCLWSDAQSTVSSDRADRLAAEKRLSVELNQSMSLLCNCSSD
jgi:hypothetical protein